MPLIDYFKNPNGKRALWGIVLMIAGLAGWFMGKDSTVATIVIGIGGTLLGITSPKIGG